MIGQLHSVGAILGRGKKPFLTSEPLESTTGFFQWVWARDDSCSAVLCEQLPHILHVWSFESSAIHRGKNTLCNELSLESVLCISAIHVLHHFHKHLIFQDHSSA